jgi:transposase
MKKQRKQYAPEEKVAILRRHLLEKEPISKLCDEVGLQPTVFYRWQKEFFENGHAAFHNGRKSKAVEDANLKKIEQLQAKLVRKNEVMAELMEAHTELKKSLGEL